MQVTLQEVGHVLLLLPCRLLAPEYSTTSILQEVSSCHAVLPAREPTRRHLLPLQLVPVQLPARQQASLLLAVCELALVDLFRCRRSEDVAHLGRTQEHANCRLAQAQEDLPRPVLLRCRKSEHSQLHVRLTLLKYRSLLSLPHVKQEQQQH